MTVLRRLLEDYRCFTIFQRIIFWVSVTGMIVIGVGTWIESNFGIITLVGFVLVGVTGALFTGQSLVTANREPIRNELVCASYIVINWMALFMIWAFVVAIISGVSIFVTDKISIPSYLGIVSVLTYVVYTLKPIQNYQKNKNQ